MDESEKLQRLHEITGLEDHQHCANLLDAHGGDVDAAVATFFDMDDSHPAGAGNPSVGSSHSVQSLRSRSPSSLSRNDIAGASSHSMDAHTVAPRTPPRNQFSFVWRVITLPFWMARGSFGIVKTVCGFGYWAAGGIVSYSFTTLGSIAARTIGTRQTYNLAGQAPLSAAAQFIQRYEAEYGSAHPNFVESSFGEALRRAVEQAKFLFVYLHSSQHANTPSFCRNTLSSEAVISFINENFVAWGGDVRNSEGFQLSTSFKATTYPFCAIVTSSSNRRVALLQLVEGPVTDIALISTLQHVLDEHGATLVAQRMEEEERNLNRRLREEQDEAFRAALRADQELERKRREEEERKLREEQEEERRRKEEEEKQKEEMRIASEKQAYLERLRKEKSELIGPEPPKGPDVTQILIRLPGGERKERRFHCESKVKAIYDFVDSLGLLPHDAYNLVISFPLTVFDHSKLDLTLKEAGLHPHTSLFVKENDV